MATGFPVKANYATGDVLTAANMNDLAGTLNYLDPTAKGDLFPASDGSTLTRLAVGTNGQVLTADSTATTGIKWATATSASWTTIASGTCSGSSVVLSSIPTTYKQLILVVQGMTNNTANGKFNLYINGATTPFYASRLENGTGASLAGAVFSTNATSDRTDANNIFTFNFTRYDMVKAIHAVSGTYFIGATGGTQGYGSVNGGVYDAGVVAITSITFSNTGGTFSAGDYYLYGVN